MKGGVVESTEAQPVGMVGLWTLRAVVVLVALAVAVVPVWSGVRSYDTVDGFIDETPAAMKAAGKTAALLAGTLLLLQFALSARLKWLDRVFPLDRLLSVHSVSGALAVLLAILHPLLLLASRLYPREILEFMAWPLGVGAVLLLLLGVIAVTSLFRRFLEIRYETWRTIHLATFAAVAAMAVHSLWVGQELAEGGVRGLWMGLLAGFGALFVWVKVAKPLFLRALRFEVVAVQHLSPEVTNIELAVPDGVRFRYRPGQFAFLTLYRGCQPIEEHPFTISSSPTRPGQISFTIKSSGDFTATIPATRPGNEARVDGPYGQFSILYHPATEFVFIAGGIGITPLMSNLRCMADTGDRRPVTLVWACRTRQDAIFADELDELKRRLPGLCVQYVFSEEPDWSGEQGLLDEPRLERLLKDVNRHAAVFLCGPPPMMKVVAKGLRRQGFSRRRIHTERFSL